MEDDGSLRVSFQTGMVNESAPQAWQERDGKQVPVRIAFAPHGNAELTFAVGEYDRSEPLFIDPTLTWNTFLGGAGTDEAYGLALDVSGNVYVSGYSTQTWGSPVTAYGGGGVDGFAAKLDSNGNLIWNTFLGGAGNDEAFGIALDATGNLYWRVTAIRPGVRPSALTAAILKALPRNWIQMEIWSGIPFSAVAGLVLT